LWSKPYGNRWLNRVGWLLGLASLLFAQSKTSWIAFVICLSCLVYYRHGDIPGKSFTRSNPSALMAIILLAMLGCCALAFTAMFGGDEIASFFETRAGADLLTLTGRDEIWEVAVDEWRNHPVFGYGLNIWNDAHRQQIGLPWAFNAHNQFYQSLSSSGIIGALGLVFYGTTLLGFTLKTRKSSHGLTLALLALIFVRSISEVPLTLSGYAPDLLTHALLLMLIAAHFSDKTHVEHLTGATSQRRFVPH
jgi:O-antigen ligase